MSDLSCAVTDLMRAQFRPAGVWVAKDWCVQECWGDLGVYGLAEMRVGMDVRELVPALHGFEFDGAEQDSTWPFVETASGLNARCCLQCYQGGYLIAWFDVSVEHDLVQQVQQLANESWLARKR